VVPADAPGLRMISREPVTTGSEDPADHPLDARGEESDSLLIFDNVFVPWQYVFSYKNKTITQVYNVLGRFAFWKVVTRLSYRAEIFAGAAQMIVNALGTDNIPAVRALVADVVAYAATLRACVTAAVETAQPTESGIMLPNPAYVSAGRLHSLVRYPKIMQALRELSGQGLISRVPRATWERQDMSSMLDEFLPGYKVSALDKNRLFNLIWDMTCSAAAMRIALFENINASTAANLREDLYRTFDRSEAMELIRKVAGMGTS
jgi:4-hydroxyphenylacetate 3-monooxygenase